MALNKQEMIDMKRGKATFIRDVSDEGFRGEARLYKLEPKLKNDWSEEDEFYEYVIVSGVNGLFAPETFIFGAHADGAHASFLDLKGSFEGSIDHAKALRNAGYEVVANGR